MPAPQRDPVSFKLEDMLIANYGVSAKRIVDFDRFHDWQFTHAQFLLLEDGRTYVSYEGSRALLAFRDERFIVSPNPSVYLIVDDTDGALWDASQRELQAQIETNKSALTDDDWRSWYSTRPQAALRLVECR